MVSLDIAINLIYKLWSSLFQKFFCCFFSFPIAYKSIGVVKVGKRVKIRNRNNQVPHLIQDTNGKVTTSQLNITNESQEISPFPAGDHKASTNRRA